MFGASSELASVMEFGFYRWELVDLPGAPVDHLAVSLVHQLDRLRL